MSGYQEPSPRPAARSGVDGRHAAPYATRELRSGSALRSQPAQMGGQNPAAPPELPAPAQVRPVPKPARGHARSPPRQWSEQGAARGMRARSAGSTRYDLGYRSPNRARSDWTGERR